MTIEEIKRIERERLLAEETLFRTKFNLVSRKRVAEILQGITSDVEILYLMLEDKRTVWFASLKFQNHRKILLGCDPDFENTVFFSRELRSDQFKTLAEALIATEISPVNPDPLHKLSAYLKAHTKPFLDALRC